MPTDAWMEKAFICVTQQGGSDIEFSILVDSIKDTKPKEEVDQQVLVNGGRVVVFKPSDMGEITIKGFPTDVGTTTSTTTATGFDDMMGAGMAASAQPISVVPDFNRYKYRVVIAFTDDTAVTKATNACTSGKRMVRFKRANCYVTSIENDEFTAENPLKKTITFKYAAFDKSADKNFTDESTDGSGTLGAVSAYTSTTKW